MSCRLSPQVASRVNFAIMAERHQEKDSKEGMFSDLTGGSTGGFSDLTEKNKDNEGGILSGITGGQTGGFKDLVNDKEDNQGDRNEGGVLSGIRGGESGGVQELTEGDDEKKEGGLFSGITGGSTGGFDDVTQEGKTPGRKAQFMQGLKGEGKGTEDSQVAKSNIHPQERMPT
jgi:hypothetical protein